MQRILTFSLVLSIFINSKLLLAMNTTQQQPWNPIDVVGANVTDIDNPHGHWQTGDPDRGWIDSKFNVWGNVRSKYEYRLPHLQNGRMLFYDRMVFIVIHGSVPAPKSGPLNPSYYDPNNYDNQNFRHIMRFASHLAQLQGKEIDLLSFQWSGLIDETARKVASMLLTRYIQTHYAQGTDIVILSHSHGCNIANLVSRQLSWPIKLLIHFANPVRVNNEPIPTGVIESLKWAINNPLHVAYGLSESYNDSCPDKFETLIYFYSTSDVIAMLGTLKKMNAVAGVANGFAIHYAGNYVIDTVVDVGSEFNAPLKILKFGKHILRGFQYSAHLSNAKTCYDLTLATLKDAYIHDTQSGKIVVGVRTQIDGKDPGHATIINIVQDLPNIYTCITNNYVLHFLNSSLFDLHVNMQQANNIHMAIRRVNNPNAIPVNPLANQMLGQHNFQQIVQIGQQETQFSTQQTQAYRAHHNRDLNNVTRDQNQYLSAIESRCNIM